MRDDRGAGHTERCGKLILNGGPGYLDVSQTSFLDFIGHIGRFKSEIPDLAANWGWFLAPLVLQPRPAIVSGIFPT